MKVENDGARGTQELQGQTSVRIIIIHHVFWFIMIRWA
jgi:hypothetical protein